MIYNGPEVKIALREETARLCSVTVAYRSLDYKMLLIYITMLTNNSLSHSWRYWILIQGLVSIRISIAVVIHYDKK